MNRFDLNDDIKIGISSTGKSYRFEAVSEIIGIPGCPIGKPNLNKLISKVEKLLGLKPYRRESDFSRGNVELNIYEVNISRIICTIKGKRSEKVDTFGENVISKVIGDYCKLTRIDSQKLQEKPIDSHSPEGGERLSAALYALLKNYSAQFELELLTEKDMARYALTKKSLKAHGLSKRGS